MSNFRRNVNRNKSPKLTVILVSYNTKNLTDKCLESLLKNNSNIQVIVADNGSQDGSVEMIKDKYKEVLLLENKKNLGFSKANNKAGKYAKSEFILFLNTDTIVLPGSVKNSLACLLENDTVGALTCRVELPNGKLDPDTIRSFPYPWVAFTHFSGLSKVFPKSKLFSRYRYGYVSTTKSKLEVDVIQGAFFLTRKSVLDEVGWFDEDYFLDGEDIDLSWKIKNAGYKIIYFADTKIIHYKKASKKSDRKKSLQSVLRGVEAMRVFYKKHMFKRYNIFVNILVITGINTIKFTRIIGFYIQKFFRHFFMLNK